MRVLNDSMTKEENEWETRPQTNDWHRLDYSQYKKNKEGSFDEIKMSPVKHTSTVETNDVASDVSAHTLQVNDDEAIMDVC